MSGPARTLGIEIADDSRLVKNEGPDLFLVTHDVVHCGDRAAAVGKDVGGFGTNFSQQMLHIIGVRPNEALLRQRNAERAERDATGTISDHGVVLGQRFADAGEYRRAPPGQAAVLGRRRRPCGAAVRRAPEGCGSLLMRRMVRVADAHR
jgi:hypothetical protein